MTAPTEPTNDAPSAADDDYGHAPIDLDEFTSERFTMGGTGDAMVVDAIRALNTAVLALDDALGVCEEGNTIDEDDLEPIVHGVRKARRDLTCALDVHAKPQRAS